LSLWVGDSGVTPEVGDCTPLAGKAASEPARRIQMNIVRTDL
jgi:hypothetical protein